MPGSRLGAIVTRGSTGLVMPRDSSLRLVLLGVDGFLFLSSVSMIVFSHSVILHRTRHHDISLMAV